MSDVTQILHAIQNGNEQAAGDLRPLVYEELRKLAAQFVVNERQQFLRSLRVAWLDGGEDAGDVTHTAWSSFSGRAFIPNHSVVGFGSEPAARLRLAALSNDASFCFHSAAIAALPVFGAVPFQIS